MSWTSFLQVFEGFALRRVARPEAQLAAALRLPLHRWSLQARALAAQIGRSPLLHEQGLGEVLRISFEVKDELSHSMPLSYY